MKAISPQWGTVVVCSIALSALLVNQSAQAQRGNQVAPLTIFKSERITSADPGFRYASAAVLSPLRQSGINSPLDQVGAGVMDNSIYKDFFSHQAVRFPKEATGGDAVMSRLTPGQAAIAETLFTQTNLSGIKDLAVTSSSIRGTVSQRELGLTQTQIKQQTVARLQVEIKTANAAIAELQ